MGDDDSSRRINIFVLSFTIFFRRVNIFCFSLSHSSSCTQYCMGLEVEGRYTFMGLCKAVICQHRSPADRAAVTINDLDCTGKTAELGAPTFTYTMPSCRVQFNRRENQIFHSGETAPAAQHTLYRYQYKTEIHHLLSPRHVH